MEEREVFPCLGGVEDGAGKVPLLRGVLREAGLPLLVGAEVSVSRILGRAVLRAEALVMSKKTCWARRAARVGGAGGGGGERGLVDGVGAAIGVGVDGSCIVSELGAEGSDTSGMGAAGSVDVGVGEEGAGAEGCSKAPVAPMMLPSRRERIRTPSTSGRVERCVNVDGSEGI